MTLSRAYTIKRCKIKHYLHEGDNYLTTFPIRHLLSHRSLILYTNHPDFPSEGVCLAQHESSLNTAAIGRLNYDGSVDHGLFQISDIYWCDWRSNEPHRRYKNACRMNCNCKLLV